MNMLKKGTAVLAAWMLTFGICGVIPGSTAAEEATVYGDVNEDGSADLLDVIMLNKNLMIGTEISEQGLKNADVDLNGKVDAVDSLNILKYAVKLITLPVGGEEPTEEPTEYPIILGDVDGDAWIGAADAAEVLRDVVRRKSNVERTLTSTERKAADVDGDGAVTAEDAMYILRYAAMYGAGELVMSFEEALEEDAIPQPKNAGEVTIRVDSKEMELEDVGIIVPVYIRAENIISDKFESITFGLKIDERCEYDVITDTQTAYKYGGEMLDYWMTYQVSEEEPNTVWFTVAANNWEESDTANLVMIALALPGEIRYGDDYYIELLTDEDTHWTTAGASYSDDTRRYDIRPEHGYVHINEQRNPDYIW